MSCDGNIAGRRRLVLEPPSEKEGGTWPVLPEDLVAEILSWLPVKSILPLKCVCKSWKSLISSSYFVNNHLHRSATDPNPRLLVGDYTGHKFLLSRSLRSLIDNPSSSPSSPPIFDDDLSFDVLPDSMIVGSCNGLICWVHIDHRFSNDPFVIYLNPSTKLKSIAPHFRHPWRDRASFSTMFGFGYDHLSHSYKTVAIYCGDSSKADNIEKKTMVMVYALGEDTSWRNMQSFPFFPYGDDECCGKFVSGTLNWLATRPDGYKVVVSVDIAKETCGEVLLPDFVNKYHVLESPKLCVLRDCLCFSHHFINGVQFILWQMKLYGAKESWTILLDISYLHVGIDHHFHFHPTPVFMLDNGQVLLKINNWGDFVLYNPTHKSFKCLKFRSSKLGWCGGITHIESLVSPCPTHPHLVN